MIGRERARPRVKVCGLTRPQDAELAVRLGADAVGFVLWPQSPRAVAIDAVAAITRDLPAFVTRVGVVVDMDRGELERAARIGGLDVVQLHGRESLSAYRGLAPRIVKAIALESDADVDAALALPADVTVLVDAADPVKRGGTGRRADWARAAELARRRPIVLAGGLTPENVAEAIAEVNPWGIDVSSGVEEAPGVKSASRMQSFFDAVAHARAEVL